MTFKLSVAVIAALLLNACIVQPMHSGNKKKQSIQTKVVLEKEHKSPTVVIVTRLPKKGRKCWSHQQHWHCRKN